MVLWPWTCQWNTQWHCLLSTSIKQWPLVLDWYTYQSKYPLNLNDFLCCFTCSRTAKFFFLIMLRLELFGAFFSITPLTVALPGHRMLEGQGSFAIGWFCPIYYDCEKTSVNIREIEFINWWIQVSSNISSSIHFSSQKSIFTFCWWKLRSSFRAMWVSPWTSHLSFAFQLTGKS